MTEPAIWLNTTPLTDAHWRRLPPALRARLRHRLGGKASILNRQVLDIAQALCERGTYDLAFGFYQVLDGEPLMPYQGCGFGLMMNLKALMGERAPIRRGSFWCKPDLGRPEFQPREKDYGGCPR